MVVVLAVVLVEVLKVDEALVVTGATVVEVRRVEVDEGPYVEDDRAEVDAERVEVDAERDGVD